MAMGKIKIEYADIVDKALKQVLDDTTINNISIRKWIEKIVDGEYQEVTHERYVFSGKCDDEGRKIYNCSGCNMQFRVFPENAEYFVKNERYCSWCGARMDGTEEGD